MLNRVIWGVFLITAIFWLPWWVILIFSLASLFYFDNFIEIVPIAILFDVLYGSYYFTGYPYLISFISIILLFFIVKFKSNLTAY
jgi:hypothetical protein